MSITDELRDCIRTANRSYEDARNPYNDREILHIPEEELLAIADRIDAEYQKAIRELNNLADASVLLPVDADGVPIHVGDELDGLHYEDGTVTGIQYGTDGRTMIAVRPNGWDTSTWRDPEEYCHHITDTWERIIEDAAKLARGDNDAVMELVGRCRRLAGEE